MKINFNLTGKNRKPLVAAASQILNAPAVYLFAPTLAYQIGEYTIDKSGAVVGPDNRELVAELQKLHSFVPVSEEYDALPPEMNAAPAAVCADADRLTIEMPLDGFTPEKLDNLMRLVSAKAPLLKAALAVEDLPIQQTGDTLRFPWFWPENILAGEEVEAFSALVALICKAAKAKKRVTAKARPVEGSPKYAMRCFLLSLGFIGDEYKTSRRVLLSRLEGSAAWKNK